MGDQRINAGHLLAALGATVLLASLFTDWYGDGTQGLSGWASFEAVDVIVALTAIVALWVVLPLGVAAERGLRRVPEIRAVAVPLAILTVLLVLANVLGRPPLARGFDLEIGALLALGGSLALLVGLLVAESRFSVVIRVVPRNQPTVAQDPGERAPTTPLEDTGTPPEDAGASPAGEAETRAYDEG
jgi:hypothetical protein